MALRLPAVLGARLVTMRCSRMTCCPASSILAGLSSISFARASPLPRRVAVLRQSGNSGDMKLQNDCMMHDPVDDSLGDQVVSEDAFLSRYIQCQQALYSVPSTACPPGQEVEVRLNGKLVRIYHKDQLIKVHQRQPEGGRSTVPADYPAVVPGTPPGCRTRSSARRPRWGLRWTGLSRDASKARCPGPRSGRDTSCSGWGSATLPCASTPPVSGPFRWTSSMCIAWYVSWSKAWNGTPMPNDPGPGC